MRRRLLVAFTVFVLVELGVFYWRHHDLVRLSLGREFVIADPKFTSAATSVLSEEEVSRRVLERIADVAGVRGERDLQIRALARIVQAFPDDAGTRLRLAQALREAGRFEEAERIYRGALGLPEKRG